MPRALTLPLAAVALAAASVACEKPTPLVTLYAAGHSVNARATLDGAAAVACTDMEQGPSPAAVTFKLKGRHEIGIDVPGEVADAGWRILQLQNDPVSHDRYRRIGPFVFPPDAEPQLLTIAETSGPQAVQRCWQFLVQGE